MQSRLIKKGTAQHGMLIGVIADRQSVKPRRAVLIEMPFDTNFIRDHGSSFWVPLFVGTL
jgi:hypothetical protein